MVKDPKHKTNHPNHFLSVKYIHIVAFLILKLETYFSFRNRFQHSSSFVSDTRTSLVTVNMVIFLASQFDFQFVLIYGQNSVLEAFSQGFSSDFFFVWFGFGTATWCHLSIVGLFFVCWGGVLFVFGFFVFFLADTVQ